MPAGDVVVAADAVEETRAGFSALARELRARGYFGSAGDRSRMICELVEALSDGAHSPAFTFEGPYVRRLTIDCVLYERDSTKRKQTEEHDG